MKPLSLLLQNSSGQLSIGLARNGCVLFDSDDYASLQGSRNILEYVTFAGSCLGSSVDQINKVYVDIGPGGLGATRSTVAFANALGYAKNIPVVGLNAFELIGFHVAQKTGKPVVCIRPAARPDYYVGIFEDGRLSSFSFSNKEIVLELIRSHRENYVFAGKYSFGPEFENGDDFLPLPEANSASMASFLSVADAATEHEPDSSRVYPITERLEISHVRS